jgi:hypothetical protein
MPSACRPFAIVFTLRDPNGGAWEATVRVARQSGTSRITYPAFLHPTYVVAGAWSRPPGAARSRVVQVAIP